MATDLDPRARPAAAPARRRPLTAGRLAIWAGMMALGVMSVRATLDPDMWWHLRAGEWILGRGIPRGDVFSFTVPGKEWITHEWLSQVVMWAVQDAFGAGGLMIAFGLVAIATFVIVFRTCPGGPLLKLAVTAVAARAAVIAFGARPQLFNLLFAAIAIALIESVKDQRRDARRLWWLVPLIGLWANFHSGFLFGVVLVGTYALGDGLQRRFGGTDSRLLPVATVRRLWLVAAGGIAASVVNPSHVKLLTYPFVTLRSDAMQDTIAEWQSPNFHDTLFWPFIALLLAGVAAFAWSTRRPTLSELLLFGGTAFAALQSLRHVSLFAVVAAPIVARHLISALDGTRLGPWVSGEKDRELRVGPIFGAGVAVVLAVAGLATVLATIGANTESVEREYPVAAVDWIEENGLARGYNEYAWGGYLIWRGHEVFVDGRADVYGDELVYEASALTDGDVGWDETLDRFDIGHALVATDGGLRPLLDASPEWRLAYEDDLARVYVR